MDDTVYKYKLLGLVASLKELEIQEFIQPHNGLFANSFKNFLNENVLISDTPFEMIKDTDISVYGITFIFI